MKFTKVYPIAPQSFKIDRDIIIYDRGYGLLAKKQVANSLCPVTTLCKDLYSSNVSDIKDISNYLKNTLIVI